MKESFYKHLEVTEVAPYIFKVKFLTPEFCRYIMKACNGLNTWAPAEQDKDFFTQDINFKEELPTLFKSISTHLIDRVFPVVGDRMSAEIEDPYTIFAIKYSMEGQRSLPLHRDESYVSGSIKLNEDYEGADLVFPEQGFTNKDIEVGDLLLWPGSITHPHACDYLMSGEKYSLTIWTPYPELTNQRNY
jgi:hypothetical protein